MNIDELTKKIRSVSSESVVQGLADYLLEWKTNDKNALQLMESVERYFGNSWIENDKDYERIYKMWTDFRDEAINGIDGMTMNERLFWFGMFEMFDKAKNDDERQKLYDKLMARK